jgi:hypothetical protein
LESCGRKTVKQKISSCTAKYSLNENQVYDSVVRANVQAQDVVGYVGGRDWHPALELKSRFPRLFSP